jgi:hypothetical protein
LPPHFPVGKESKPGGKKYGNQCENIGVCIS